MKISKKLVSFMLALAMVVTAMAVQTVPVQAATEISFDNVNKKSITIRAGGVYKFKTNYKASKLNYKTSNKSIVKSLGNGKIKAVKKGTAKVTVSLKNDATEKATVTVHVQSKPSSNCKITLSRICESLVEETYNKKTKKSDYRVYIDTEELGKDLLDVYTELYQAFEDITKVAPLGDKLLPKNYSRSLTNLEQQAANEWFAERYIKKGMILETGATSEEILDIVNDEVITANRKYPELLQLNSQAAVNTLLDYDFIRRSTWRSYNPEINTVRLINPAQHIVDYELRFEKEHR